MRYAVAALLMLYGALCVLWPDKVYRALQGRFAEGLPDSYHRRSIVALRIIGIGLVIALPVLIVVTAR